MFYGENALFDFCTEKYLARIVTSPNQLVEKIQIFDAGKDDRIMELVKLLVTDSLHENNPDTEFDELRFAVDDDGTNILVIINKGEITGAVDIDNMYEFASSHCNDFKDLRDDDEIVINMEWILNKLAEAENEYYIWWLHPQAPVESITPVLDIKNPAPALFIKIFCFLIFNTLY